MKKNLLKSFIIFLLLPVLVFVGCKDKNSLPKIAISQYFKDEIKISRQGFAQTATDSISLLTQNEADEANFSKYTKIDIEANPVWMYKMFIEKISFYVYCNESSASQMIINLKITNVASEEAIFSSTQEAVESETFESQCTIEPQAKKAIKCNFDISRAVIVATGSTFSIDILNSLELYSSTDAGESTFQWLIYGLEVHGESRAYTR